jgi:hypothetical protein
VPIALSKTVQYAWGNLRTSLLRTVVCTCFVLFASWNGPKWSQSALFASNSSSGSYTMCDLLKTLRSMRFHQSSHLGKTLGVLGSGIAQPSLKTDYSKGLKGTLLTCSALPQQHLLQLGPSGGFEDRMQPQTSVDESTRIIYGFSPIFLQGIYIFTFTKKPESVINIWSDKAMPN